VVLVHSMNRIAQTGKAVYNTVASFSHDLYMFSKGEPPVEIEA